MIYGLHEKKLVDIVCDFKGRTRKPCPALIMHFFDAELNNIDVADRGQVVRERNAEIVASQNLIDAWFDKDLDAQAFIVKYLGSSEQTHVRSCDYAFQMWDALKKYYNLQGEIEVANAQAQLSAILQTESEGITVYVRRLQELHSILDNLGEPVSETKKATNCGRHCVPTLNCATLKHNSFA